MNKLLLIFALVCALGISIESCGPLTEDMVSDEDETSHFRFSAVGETLWINSQGLRSTSPTNITSSSDLGMYPMYPDTVVVSTKRLLRFPDVYAIEQGSVRLLGRTTRDYNRIAVALNDNIALVAARPDSAVKTLSMKVYDIAQDREPVLISSVEFDNIELIELYGTTVYVDEGQKISVVDLTDPAHPRKIRSVPAVAVRYMTAKDPRLVLTTETSIIQMDISDPLDPRRISEIR